jgi:hypothetical protein
VRISLIIFFCVVMSGCDDDSFKDYELDANSFTAKKLAMVQKEIGMSLPVGARGLNMYYHGSRGKPCFVAKIDLPAASWENFTKQIKQIPVKKDWYLQYPLSKRVSWWNQSKDSVRVERFFIIGSTGAFVQLLLCEEHGRFTLYIEFAG